MNKKPRTFRESDEVWAILDKYALDHKINTTEALAQKILSDERFLSPTDQGSPAAGASDPLPFEAHQSAYPIHPSRLLQIASKNTSPNMNHGETDTTQYSQFTPKQQQTLAFDKERLNLRVAAFRTMEQEKRETVRQSNFRKPQERPVQYDAHPDTHAVPLDSMRGRDAYTS